jgi:hypothetical protein
MITKNFNYYFNFKINHYFMAINFNFRPDLKLNLIIHFIANFIIVYFPLILFLKLIVLNKNHQVV